MALFVKRAKQAGFNAPKEPLGPREAETEEAQESAPARKIRGRLPEKRTINLATVNQQKINWFLAIPLILLICAGAAAFSKFAVMDRIAAAEAARGEVYTLREQIDSTMKKMSQYDGLSDLYAHYTTSGMTAEELSRADRVEIMEMMERVVFPRMNVQQWSVKGNELKMEVSGETLEAINELVQQMMEEPIVDYCTLKDAASHIRESRETPESEIETVSGNVVALLTLPGAEEAES